MIIAGGAPGRLIDYWIEEKFELVSSIAQLEELRRVLNYTRLQKRITRDKGDAMLVSMAASAILVGSLPEVHLSDDADDNLIFATALAGNADVIVSGE